MKVQHVLFILIVEIAVGRCILAASQTGETNQVTESIQVSDNRPLAAALEALEKKYGLAITYEDPIYSHPSDIQDVTPLLSIRPVTSTSHRLLVPKKATFRFQYVAGNGKPVEDTRSLIRRMLTEYSALGNPAFDVQERATKYGPEWHVFPTEVRTTSGSLLPQAALLDNIVNIPNQKRTYTKMLDEIIDQVSNLSGYRVMGGNFPVNAFFVLQNHEENYGADNRPARQALAELLGPSYLWYLFYVPGDRMYVLNIHSKAVPPSNVPVPQRFSPLDESGHLINPGPRVSRAEAYQHVSPAMLRHYPWSKTRIPQVQLALARAGFYHDKATGIWDTQTMEALKMFQSANSLPPTGRLDKASLQKLGVDFTSAPVNLPKPQ
jgi:putative peptidoglycan binding protein